MNMKKAALKKALLFYMLPIVLFGLVPFPLSLEEL
jgi:hypothetical protein